MAPSIVGVKKLECLSYLTVKTYDPISSFVWVQYHHVTYRRTDRQTDGRSLPYSYYAPIAYLLSRVKSRDNAYHARILFCAKYACILTYSISSILSRILCYHPLMLDHRTQ